MRDTRDAAIYCDQVMTRAVASIIVVALLSPGLAAIGCDVLCTVAGRSGQTKAMDMATCHEHHVTRHGPSVMATHNGPCHNAVDSPSAVLADSQQWFVSGVAASAPMPASLDRHATPARAWMARPPGSSPPRLASQLRV